MSEKQYNKAVLEAVESFNFNNVFTYMKTVNWFTANAENEEFLPSPEMLKTEVLRKFDLIWKEDSTCIGSGGFYCGIENDNSIYITFTCEEVSIDVEIDE